MFIDSEVSIRRATWPFLNSFLVSSITLTAPGVQGHGNHPFGTELEATIFLFQKKSILAKKESGLPNLLRMLCHDVSAQAVLPWNIIPLLLDVLGQAGEEVIDQSDADVFQQQLQDMGHRLNSDTQTKQILSSIVGQPMLVTFLSFIIQCSPLLSDQRHPDLLSDCVTGLNLIRYIVDCVRLSVPLDSRIRILERARINPMRPSELHTCPNAENGGHGPLDRCELCTYSRENFRIRGQHFPGLPVTQPRVRYLKDKMADKEKEEEQHGCDKDFVKGKPGSKTSGGLMTL